MGAVSNEAESKIPTVVWGTGNVGRASIRAVTANPALELVGVIVANPEKVGRDAGDLADLGVHLGVAATDDADAVLAASPGAVVYAASGDIRPDDAVADITRALAAGAVVVTPSVYALYDPKSAPPELRDPVEAAAKAGGGALFVSGIDRLGQRHPADSRQRARGDNRPDPVSGNLRLHDLRTAGFCPLPDRDGSADGLRTSHGRADRTHHGLGRQIRLIARALGVELDEIRETLLRRPLEETVSTEHMGEFAAGTQGALRFEVQGIVGGEP